MSEEKYEQQIFEGVPAPLRIEIVDGPSMLGDTEEEINKNIDLLVSSATANIGDLVLFAKTWRNLSEYLVEYGLIITEEYRGAAWFKTMPIMVQIAAIDAYINSRGEEAKTNIEAQKKPFLAFFKTYISLLETAYHQAEDKDLETLQAKIFEQLTSMGLLYGNSVITGVGGRQLAITDLEYQFALTPRANETAYISPLRNEIMAKITFKDGKLSIPGSQLEPAALKMETTSGMQSIKKLDLPLLRQVFTAIYKTARRSDMHTVTVDMASFCREMGMDFRKLTPPDKPEEDNPEGNKFIDVLGKLTQFENCIGVSKGVYYELLRIIVVDTNRNTITFATPYMNYILREIESKNLVRDREGKTKYIQPRFSWLMHSTIASERNKPAVEIANRIIAGLLQRGGMPDAKLHQNKKKKGITPDIITYRTTFSNIIEGVPILKEMLEGSTTANKNSQLRRAFKKAYELLKKQTDIYQYYIELKIPDTIPTSTTLGNSLVITHQGENGNYQSPSGSGEVY